MLNETFYLDGVDARSAGVQLQDPVEFDGATPIVESETIPGRNGDLIFETGGYKNRTGKASCFCLQNGVEQALSVAGRYLMGKHGYRRLETSDDPNHFWMARITNSPEISQRLRWIAPFDIKFDCKPQKFLKQGENYVHILASGTVLNNPYWFPALPLIKVEGSGAGVLKVGQTTVEIKSMDGVLYLDCDTQTAYNALNVNQNGNINAPVFPTLVGGENMIEFSGGITSVRIMPRWWEL